MAALMAVSIGIGLGAINGLLVAYGGVPAIITPRNAGDLSGGAGRNFGRENGHHR